MPCFEEHLGKEWDYHGVSVDRTPSSSVDSRRGHDSDFDEIRVGLSEVDNNFFDIAMDGLSRKVEEILEIINIVVHLSVSLCVGQSLVAQHATSRGVYVKALGLLLLQSSADGGDAGYVVGRDCGVCAHQHSRAGPGLTDD